MKYLIAALLAIAMSLPLVAIYTVHNSYSKTMALYDVPVSSGYVGNDWLWRLNHE